MIKKLQVKIGFLNGKEKGKDQPKMKLDLPPGGLDIFTPLFFLLSPGC
jgi:hypothetical protein